MTATTFDLFQIQTDATSYAATFRTLIGAGTSSFDGAYASLSGTPDLTAKADLVGGVVPTSQIPSVAITEYLGEVADQTAMLALSAGDRGDWCVRTDTGSVWVLVADDSSLIASWTELTYPAAPVTSVNGETGTVVLTAADVSAAAATHNHAASDINSGTFDDARIAEGNVTQHQAALSITESQISDLGTYATVASLAAVATSGSYDDLTDKPTIPAVAKVYEKVALSPNGAAIAAGTGKGFVPVSHAGTITAFSVQCDPNNEPTVTVEVDLNKVNTSDGTVTSALSSVASITSGNNSGTGTINGTQTVSVGDWLQVDIDQGSNGQDLIGIIEITPS